jgi:beta-lactamase regulating signal transducer with metallopeptidase domain
VNRVDAFLGNLFWNAAEASVLAVAVAVACRVRRITAPARHLLWLLVIVKLLLPPIAVQPLGLSAGRVQATRSLASIFTAWIADRTSESMPESQAPNVVVPSESPLLTAAELLSEIQHDLSVVKGELAGGDVAAQTQPPEEDAAPDATIAPGSVPAQVSVTRFPDWRTWFGDLVGAGWLYRSLFGIWAIGAFGLASIRLRQTVALCRLLRAAEPASMKLRSRCSSLVQRLGLRRVPRLVMTSDMMTPTVCMWGAGTIILPARLARCGDGAAIESVLGHELAHLRRHDRWSCWLELAASLAYWWLPVFWWARRRLRAAADEAADAWAVTVVGCRQRYAAALLEVVELLAAERGAVPVFGPALGERDAIARRLTMIMREPLSHRLSWPARVGVALVGLLALPAAPRTKAQEPPAPPAAGAANELPAASRVGVPTDAEFDAVLSALEQPQDVPARGRAPIPPARFVPPVQANPPGAPPAVPAPPGQRDGRSRPDPDRRLQELEEKVERVLKMLETMQRPGGGQPAGQPPAAGFGFGGFPGRQAAGAPMERARGGFGPGTGMGGGAFGGGGPRGSGPAFGGRPGMGPTTGAGPVSPQDRGRGPEGGPPHREREGHGTELLGPRLRELDLSPEQRERLEHMHREIREEVERIETEQAKVMAEFQRRRNELELRLGEMINNVLTPEQRERRQGHRPEGDRRPAESRPRDDARRPGGDRPRDGADRRGPDRPREQPEAGRAPGRDRAREGAEPQRRPDGDRPREGAEPRREPERDRPREGGELRREQPRRPEGERPRDEAASNAEAFRFYLGLFRLTIGCATV